jgi:bifunctional non-homologous end joining protein LigD
LTAGVADERVVVEHDGHQLTLTNLSKALYPEVGFTKGAVIDFYARVAPTMLTHLDGRVVTLRRFPNGVAAKGFFEKRCPSHRPPWVATALGPGDGDAGMAYCVFDSIATLVWSANLAALELHVPLARAATADVPDHVVFDLDPGAPATITECAQVAVALRDILDDLGLELFAKTSGSKGLQCYLPLNTAHDWDHTRSFALAVAQLLEQRLDGLVVTDMTRSLRKAKVLIDWSQNVPAKTTVCAYSLRATPRPTVSTPVTWVEVEHAADGEPLSFEADEVLRRIDELGDLFAPVAELRQHLPAPRS